MKKAMESSRGGPSGFTLTELIVVIGIIGVVLGLLTPVFSRIRKGARTTQCQSNLRQVFQAYKMYTNDSHTKPMVTNRPSLGLNSLPSIVAVLEPYTDRRVFRCPLDDMGFYEADESSYEFNVTAYGKVAEDALPFGGRRRRNMDPANTAAFYDYEAFHGPKDSGHGKNAVFGDGHVEAF